MKRVLVIGDVLVINTGIESILSREPGLVAMHIELTNENDLKSKMDTFKPEVIIVDETISIPDLSTLLSVLEWFPVVRLLVLGVNENRIQVFDKHEVFIHQLDDFVKEVR